MAAQSIVIGSMILAMAHQLYTNHIRPSKNDWSNLVKDYSSPFSRVSFFRPPLPDYSLSYFLCSLRQTRFSISPSLRLAYCWKSSLDWLDIFLAGQRSVWTNKWAVVVLFSDQRKKSFLLAIRHDEVARWRNVSVPPYRLASGYRRGIGQAVEEVPRRPVGANWWVLWERVAFPRRWLRNTRNYGR